MLDDGGADADRVGGALQAVGLDYEGRARPRHPLDVLVNDVGLERIGDAVVRPLEGLRVACYYGCLLVRPYATFDDQREPTSMERLMRALGAETVDWPNRTRCCGGSCYCGGPIVGALPEATLRKSFDLLKDARERGANVVATRVPALPVQPGGVPGHRCAHVPGADRAHRRLLHPAGRACPRARRADARDPADAAAGSFPEPATRKERPVPGPESNGSGNGSLAALPPRIGVYVCHCGLNIADKVDVERGRRLRRDAAGRRRRTRVQVHVLRPGPGADRAGHPRRAREPRRRRLLLAAHARGDLPARHRRGRDQPLLLPDGEHPRARQPG